MRRVLVLGAGNQGAVIARTLSSHSSVEQVTVVDMNDEKLRRLANVPRIVTVQTDVQDKKFDALLSSCDLVSGALPSELGFYAMKEAIDAGVNMVDTSFMPENPLVLDELAQKSETSIVPDCGVAPGLSHILIGHYLSQLTRAEEIHIMVGGLPQAPKPPLGYVVTWSARDLIEEYTRPARVVRENSIVSVDPFSETVPVDLLALGTLESFYTDGLRTLLHTVRSVDSMDERTLRYPGHVEKVKILRDCGLFSQELVSIDSCKVSPRDVTAEVLSRMLSGENERDLTVLIVRVSGMKEGRRVTFEGQVVDYYDDRTQFSSMARTTGFTNVAVCNLLLKGQLKEKGVIPPEILGMNPDYFGEIVGYLRGRGIRIAERREYTD